MRSLVSQRAHFGGSLRIKIYSQFGVSQELLARLELSEQIVMAHKKGQGSSRNGRDSTAQRRGIKKFGGEAVLAGNILARQCGTKWHPGRNVGMGKDYTLFALCEGTVHFDQDGRRVNIVPVEAN